MVYKRFARITRSVRLAPVRAGLVLSSGLALVLLSAACGKPAAAAGETEIARQIAGGARVIDVRTPAEFAAGHFPGALNIPLDEIASRTGEIGATDAPVVLYCRSGRRSAQAWRILNEAGFSAVFDGGALDALPQAR